MKLLSLEKTGGELVRERPARARLFEHLGIDYCCGGGQKPLSAACAASDLDLETVLRALEPWDNPAPGPERNRTWATLTELADYIERTHHVYLREALPRLSFLTEKAAGSHGTKLPALIALRDLFAGLRAVLEAHLLKKERVLFPLCRKLDTATTTPCAPGGSVSASLQVLMAAYEDISGALAQMSALTNGFTPPETACNTHRVLLHALAELEANLRRHLHKEDNLLFPWAEAVEVTLAARKR